ncbi:MAG: hypothetical protein E6Q98_09725 [Rhodospirillaceae bacterium]|nr:MAG: hypothetical protein E6Q98_09725 [Rhodospirillaceae bacterium]
MADETDSILLAGRYEILPDEPLPHLDSPGAMAFAVRDHQEAGKQLFALIAPGHLPCRAFQFATQTMNPLTVLWPVSAGIVDWRLSGGGEGENDGDALWGRRPVLVFRPPTGERIIPMTSNGGLNTALPQWTESQIIKQLLQPIVRALRDLSASGITHRAIRPDNLFYQLGDSGAVMLGECFSMPPGYAQPAIFETIESGSAHPYGRPTGSQSDDLYALGVLCVMFYLGRNPLAGMSDEQITLAKINYGSFAALAGREKLPPSLTEALRGLLNDKVTERWNLRTLESWLDGQHFNPVLPYLPQRATRPINFAGVDHFNRPSIGHAMAWNWSEAISLVDKPDFENWMRRSFNDEKINEALVKIRAMAQGYGPNATMRDRLVGRLVLFLGQPVPICYRDIRVCLTGMSTLLAEILDKRDLLNQFAEMMRAKLPQAWIQEQASLRPEQIQALKPLDEAEKYLDRAGYGYGIERALYELDPNMPCRSALIGDFYVTHLRDLLPALDAALPGVESGTKPIDRHIAAFIAAGLKRSIDREMAALNNAATGAAQAIAILNLLAIVQGVHPNIKLPHLAQAMKDLLQPVIASFHLTGTREHVQKQLDRHVNACDFGAMLVLFDPEGPLRRGDEIGFTAAKHAYRSKSKEIDWIEDGGLTEADRVRLIAHRTAAVTSAFAASVGLAIFAMLMVL